MKQIRPLTKLILAATLCLVVIAMATHDRRVPDTYPLADTMTTTDIATALQIWQGGFYTAIATSTSSAPDPSPTAAPPSAPPTTPPISASAPSPTPCPDRITIHDTGPSSSTHIECSYSSSDSGSSSTNISINDSTYQSSSARAYNQNNSSVNVTINNE